MDPCIIPTLRTTSLLISLSLFSLSLISLPLSLPQCYPFARNLSSAFTRLQRLIDTREMHAARGNETVPSPPPPLPKSPPEYPDLYGKRRELAKIQMLEREIGFLQEEVKSVEGHQPASKACKEVVDFVTCNADPLMPIGKKIRRSRCFWKRLCKLSCFNVSWISCCCFSSDLEKPRCCERPLCSCSNQCVSFPTLDCSCSSCWNSLYFKKSKCSWDCCMLSPPSCLSCCSTRCRCYPKHTKVNMCSCCNKTSCYSCCYCF